MVSWRVHHEVEILVVLAFRRIIIVVFVTIYDSTIGTWYVICVENKNNARFMRRSLRSSTALFMRSDY